MSEQPIKSMTAARWHFDDDGNLLPIGAAGRRRENVRILHVDPRMFQRMQEHANNADLNVLDPAVAALAPTGIDAEALGRPTRVIVDLEIREDQPDGWHNLDP